MMNNIDTLLAAIEGFKLEHGIEPSYILTTTDIFRSISHEIGTQSGKYKGVVDIRGEHIKIAGIKLAQLPGTRTMELVVDPEVYKRRFIL